ncbi:MAG: 5-formyltetrahydrofolate cyclo-ligase [Thermodesulfovibrio sp.]|nr:5-formyltetrahydrofolate cyclo-ligase [Thermodesulfovibrio sp.]
MPDTSAGAGSGAGHAKAALRKEFLQRRNSIPPEVRKVKSSTIQSTLAMLDEIKNAGTVLLFASFRSEVSMAGMITSTLASAKRVVLPKVDVATGMLQLFEISSPDELVPGYMGIPEPSETADRKPFDINDIDAVIIPGACFDEKGNRVGYGGGYYDRLLSGLTKSIPVIAPAYEEQLVDAVPAETHDIKVSIIVTDRRVIRCDNYQFGPAAL